MKRKKKLFIWLSSICCLLFGCILLSGCSSNQISKYDKSIVMIKNAAMSTYGTGFAIGHPGKAVEHLVTSYGVIATPDGTVPKTAEIRMNESGEKLIASVIYYDTARNLAVLKLKEGRKDIKPAILKETVNHNDAVYVRGYDGTGNILSDFEGFNQTDIVQYNGYIGGRDELRSAVIYQYSTELNRAAVGAPAIDGKGNVLGMCVFSTDSISTYAQYLLSSDELIKVFSARDLDFMTADEVRYRNIIIMVSVLGVLIIGAALAIAFLTKQKKEHKPDYKVRYILAIDGPLKGKIYQFRDLLTIGRDQTNCKVVFPEGTPEIEEIHCRIQRVEDDYYLVDAFSKSGTFLGDGTRIKSELPHKMEGTKLEFYLAKPENRFEMIVERESKR